MTQDAPWTVLRLLEWTTDFFKKRGSDSPRLDAEVLLAHARDCERIELYTDFDEEPDQQQRVAFRELVRRRGEGWPVAMLVGSKEFYSLPFRVDQRTLIPRPETEHLVVEALDELKARGDQDGPPRLVDIGTGSGAIAIAIAKHHEGVTITATDISDDALAIARWNADKLNVAERITFSVGDLLEGIDTPRRFDVIVSNPPYVSEAEYNDLHASIRDYEPKSALLSGPTGTETIERLIELGKTRLQPGGRMLIELSPMIADDCVRIAQSAGAYEDVRLIKDLAGQQRILSLRKMTNDQ